MGGLNRTAGGTVVWADFGPDTEPRYELFGEIASGGMASVRYGRRIGALGFSRAVAVKRLHAQFANDSDFVSMFIDEARLSARLVHANIVATLDVLREPGEISLVMEYVHGEPLGLLLERARARREPVPIRIAVGLIASVLHGLHAAHEATDDLHNPLHVVHRDVSPQNVLVGADGVPRILDFGIARALGRLRATPSGEIKGKLAYISPEQLQGLPVDRRADVYGASVVLWETLAGRMLFDADTESALVHRVLQGSVPAPSMVNASVPRALDDIVSQGLARDPKQRFETALDMANALERAVAPATQAEVSRWIDGLIGDTLRARARALTLMQERGADSPSSEPVSTRRVSHETRRVELANSSPEFVAVPEPARDSRPSSEIRLRSRRTAMRGVIAGLLLAAAAIGALAWVQLSHHEDAESAIPLVRPAPEVPPPLAAPDVLEQPAEEVVSPSIPDAVEAKSIPPEDSRGAVVESPPPAAAKKDRRAQARKSEKPARKVAASKQRPVQAVAPPKANCDPYYYIDQEGIRRPKPECL
jgi:serine/threonine-protein kinase